LIREIVISPGRRLPVWPRGVLHSDLKANSATVEKAAGQNVPRLLVGSLENLHHQHRFLRE
jgi:hypothetical protein